MIIEDFLDFLLEGSFLIGRYLFLFLGFDTSVIFFIFVALMFLDCGMLSSCVCFYELVV